MAAGASISRGNGVAVPQMGQTSTPHQTVLVKVNAPVDEGIAGVVAALNEFPNLYTTQSCQGRDDGYAFVWFRYGKDVHESADFLVWFSKRISIVPGVRVLAEASGSTMRLELRIEHPAIHEAANRLREMVSEPRT